MFGCIYQLWDWLEAPPLFNGTMDAKKLQALQQQAGVQKKFPLTYQTNINDYHANSALFHHQQQQHTAPHQLSGYQLQAYQQSPTTTSSSGPMTPIDMQPQSSKKLMLKHALGGSNISSSTHSSPYHQSYSSSGGVPAGSNDLYQSPTERTYLTASGRVSNPSTALQQQYQQLQQAKLQMQLQTQNEAMQQQQRTFALRQAMNPPVQQGHYHMSQSSSIVSTMTLQQQQQQQQQQKQQNQQVKEHQSQQAQQQQRAPPSSLNLSSQFQPAPGPLKVQQQQYQQKSQQQNYQIPKQQQLQHDAQNIYGQHQQQLQFPLHHKQHLQHQQQQLQQDTQQFPQHNKGNEQSPIYIQQNHPGHVVNQACQTQISSVQPHHSTVASINQKATPSSEESSIKSPTHAQLDRKKSAGSIQAIKSPIAKRPPSSPVTLSGWLYKQGSDGLKVWRKRWFVLAEYCLYYYKGPEEEKLLGSILLPSYRVSACLPEDKIYRKFAFKCEHQNMRTYWLAAETGESMVQWVRSLTAATTMQAPSSSGESDQTFQPSGSSSLNHSGDNSDSGIHTIKSQQSKGQVTPASDNGATLSGNRIGNGVGATEGTQPLYANAPPKPRRFNDGGYSSPSPEHSIDNERKYQQQQHQQQQQQQQQQLQNMNRRSGIMSPTLQQMQQQNYLQQCRGPQPQQHHAIYDTRTGNVSSALRLQQAQQQYSIDKLEADLQQQMTLQSGIEDCSKSPPAPAPSAATSSTAYNNYLDMEEQIMHIQQQQQKSLPVMEDIYGERELYMQKLIQQRYPGHIGTYPNMERRTPDAYGRSKNRFFSDYEDIYNMAQSGQHLPHIIDGGCGDTSAQAALLQEAASYRRPLSPPSYDNSKHMTPFPMHYAAQHLESQTSRARPLTSIMRPHSADFLDYEARAEAAAAAAVSESGMSALMDVNSPNLKSDMGRAPRPKSSLDINRTADSLYYSEASYAEKMRKSALYLQSPGQSFTPPIANSGMNTIGYENPYERAYKRQELLNEMSAGDVQSVPRISRSTGAGMIASAARPQVPTQQQEQMQQQQAVQQHPPAQLQPPVLSPSLPTQQIIQQNDQFLRSASARLPKRSGGFEDEYISSSSMTNTITNSSTMPAAAAVVSRTHSGSGVASGGSSATQPQDGEKKREESMKRLLEWKQRMLQSPLTRKGNNSNKVSSLSKLGSNPNILLSSTAVASGAYYNQPVTNATNLSNSETTTDKKGVSGIQRSRSETQANASFNSYSSDDEDWDCMQAPAGRSTVNTSSSKTLTTTSVMSSSPSGSKKHNTTIPTIAFIGMPSTTTIKPKLTQISEPLTKANAAATNIQSASADEALKTPTILKSILKTNESFCTESPKNQKLIAKTKLRLNVSKSSKINEIQKEVVIKPKKPAPKSPQNPSYIPVYIPKLLNSGSPVRNNENIAEPGDTQDEVDQLESTKSEPMKMVTSTIKSTIEKNGDETSILANLIVYKEVQESIKTSTNISTTSDTVDCTVPKSRPSSEEEHESESGSDGSETACEEYTDNQLDEFLADEAASIMSVNDTSTTTEEHCGENKKNNSQIYVNEEFKRSESIEQFPDESHYLPMTPKRTDFGHGGDIFTLSLNDSTADEENPYVEMTKFLQDEEAKTNYEVMCIGKSNMAPLNKSSEKIKHYNEPVYMELPGAKNITKNSTSPAAKKEVLENEQLNLSSGKSILKKCKKGGDSLKKKVKKTSERVQNKRKDLPDILKPPQSSINLSSDSSDADDESSKQIDLKKMRSRTRFSLSDTFRPASYYLGASTAFNNCAESSDSEIVPPPPIPVSPPPIDELKTEEIFSSENYDTVKRRDSSTGSKMDLTCGQVPKIHSSNISLNLPKAESTLKSSRLSLPDKLSKNRYSNIKAPQSLLLKNHEHTLSDSNYSFQTDNSSNTSSDFDLYNKLRLTTPSFEITPIRYQSNSSLPQKFTSSARPIMAPGDSSEAESVELRNIQNSDSELEKHRSRRPLSRESIEAIELLNEKFEERMPTHDLDEYLDNLETSDLQLYQNSAFETRVGNGGITNLIKPPEIFRNKDDEKFYGDINFASSLDSLQKGDHDQQLELTLNTNDQTPTSTDHEQANFYTPMHSRNNSNLSEQSAPYYYSQLSSSREMLSTPTTLNNQRDIHAHGCNIKHIHNPIEKSSNTVEMFAEKYQTVDNKNLYKSNVEKLTYSPGKNFKANDSQHAYNTSHMFHLQQIASPPIKMSNFHTNKHNHAIIPDSPSHMHLTSSQTVRNIEADPNGAKSTNITMAQVENLSGGGLDNGPKTQGNGKPSRSKTTEELCNVENTSNVASKISPFLGAQNNGERLWEEDTLWRESLRRVSQRHAKSLDDLDCIAPTYAVKRDTLKSKITRDVTYVNDHVSQHVRANLNKPLTEKNSIKTEMHKRTASSSTRDEDDQLSANDVYVQLMQQRIEHPDDAKADDLYEMLREDTSSTMSHKSAEIDRETIRQWDAMSSGITTKNFPSSNSSHNNIETSIDSNSEQNTTSPLSVHAIVQQLNAKNPASINSKSPPK